MRGGVRVGAVVDEPEVVLHPVGAELGDAEAVGEPSWYLTHGLLARKVGFEDGVDSERMRQLPHLQRLGQAGRGDGRRDELDRALLSSSCSSPVEGQLRGERLVIVAGEHDDVFDVRRR